MALEWPAARFLRFAYRSLNGRLTADAKITRKIKHFSEALAWFSNSKSGSRIVSAPS